MQTRRRLHQQDQTTTQEEGYPLIPQQSQQSSQNFPHNPLFVPTNGVGHSATSPLLNSTPQHHQQQYQLQNHYQQSSIHIEDNTVASNKVSVADIDDDKYSKAGRQWNLRSLSSRIQASSGQALRNYIQQPLSAAAAVVTGNYQETTEVGGGTSYYNNNNFSGKAHPLQELDDELEDIFDKESVVVMAARDRTGEFNNAIRSLQSRNISRAVNIRDPRKAKQVQSYSEFMMVAKMIGKNIASTYAKLEKLTLCKY